ncbi:MAG TPA: AAA family ATPase [Gaiellaceae bacterium]|nr:AAA family ATPase [Gaiellaceae bacterium]
MSDSIRIYLTGACDGFDKLADALAQQPGIEVVGTSDHPAAASGALQGGHLDCVLHATSSSTFPENEVATIREHTRVPLLVIASGEASALLDDALGADVSDVLLLPALTENVVFAIRKATHAPRRAAAAGKRDGKIITVFSPKGGTGKTSIATNLAAALAKEEGRRTLLLDLDLQFGDAAIMLGIEPEKTIFDLVNAPGELDPDKLAGYTTRHKSGVEILPAPLRPEDAELVTEAKLGRLIEVARVCYDAIVVDTSPFFHGPMLATLDRTDELLLVASLDVPTLKNVRLALSTLEMLSFPRQRVRIVLNRANSKVGMKQREVEAALEQKVHYEVPSDRAVPLSVNKGVPAVIAEAGCDFSKAIEAMAKGIFPKEEPKRSGLRLRPSFAGS